MTDNKNILSDNVARRAEFKRNSDLEIFLNALNDTLVSSEETLLDKYSTPDKPIVLLVGAMRSGTTLVMQWLAQTGLVGYPSNLISRFFRAPLVGLQIQQLLADERYRFRDEFADFSPHVDFKSQNGKTTGVLAPNEFWYFWQQFIKSDKADCWTGDELRNCLDTVRMFKELHGLTDLFGKPFAAKAMKFNYAIDYLHSLSKKFVFLHVHRNHASTMVSTLDARKRQFGTIDDWYSFRVPEYEFLKTLTPPEQVAGQIHSLSKAVGIGLASLPTENVIDCSYEEFCANPAKLHASLCDRLNLDQPYEGLSAFRPSSFKDTYGSQKDLTDIYCRIADKMDNSLLA